MHSPAAALAWEFWGRHRRGLAGVCVLVLGFALFSAAVSMSAKSASLHSMWFLMCLAYVFGVFAYGFDGRLETAESGFPARLFVLPVRTWVLVGWPMLQGMATAVLLWVIWDRLVLQANGVQTPAWWTLMLAAVVATSQAIVWQPFGLPWVRLVVAIPLITAVIRVPGPFALAGYPLLDPDTRNNVLGAFAVTLISGAFLVAWSGVSRARHGETAGKLWAIGATGRSGRVWRDRPPFSSPLQAQVWYEWRRRGFSYLLTVMISVAAVMACGLLFEKTAHAMVGYVPIFLLLPPIIAGFWGSYMGGAGDPVKSLFELTAYSATRPMSNTTIVAAKLRMAARTATITWTAVVIATVVWLAATGGFHELSRMWDRGVVYLGTARIVALSVLLVVGPVLVIWRLFVVNLWVGLIGRRWVAHIQVIVMAMVMTNGTLVWLWSRLEDARFDRFLDALPWMALGAVVLKFLIAGWMLRILHRRGAMTAVTAGRLVGIWFLVAAMLFGLLVWIIPEGFVPVYGLALGVALTVPFARLASAPLALAWNRHQ
jgi:hypothetical protein